MPKRTASDGHKAPYPWIDMVTRSVYECTYLYDHPKGQGPTIKHVKEYIRDSIAPSNDYDIHSQTFINRFNAAVASLEKNDFAEHTNSMRVRLTAEAIKAVKKADKLTGKAEVDDEDNEDEDEEGEQEGEADDEGNEEEDDEEAVEEETTIKKTPKTKAAYKKSPDTKSTAKKSSGKKARH